MSYIRLCLLSLLCLVLCLTTTASVHAEEEERAFPPLYSYLFMSLEEEKEEIPLPAGTTPDSLRDTLSRLLASEPSLFFVAHTYTYTSSRDGSASSFRPQYDRTGAERRAAWEQIQEEAVRVTAPVRYGHTPLEQVIYLHEYLTENFSYDSAREDIDLYTFIDDKVGVCRSFSLYALYLCRMLDIRCEAVFNDTFTHEWIRVKLGEEWLHIDPTWDASGHGSTARYRYFLLSENRMEALHDSPLLPPLPSLLDPYLALREGTSLLVLGKGRLLQTYDGGIREITLHGVP